MLTYLGSRLNFGLKITLIFLAFIIPILTIALHYHFIAISRMGGIIRVSISRPILMIMDIFLSLIKLNRISYLSYFPHIATALFANSLPQLIAIDTAGIVALLRVGEYSVPVSVLEYRWYFRGFEGSVGMRVGQFLWFYIRVEVCWQGVLVSSWGSA